MKSCWRELQEWRETKVNCDGSEGLPLMKTFRFVMVPAAAHIPGRSYTRGKGDASLGAKENLSQTIITGVDMPGIG
ncbi:hypothetical protein BaRGS_00002336 [Batillaria attramentaria]|uniref:Uncharacterized protein n=1 Tax=Batillaria attramentaria TaxID=370345 RepID=A0ABD0M2U4_9CAEN